MQLLNKLLVAVLFFGVAGYYMDLEPSIQAYRTGSVQGLLVALTVLLLMLGVSGVQKIRTHLHRRRMDEAMSRIHPGDFEKRRLQHERH